MSIPDHEIDVPCLDEYCFEHCVGYDADKGCPECCKDEEDIQADWKIEKAQLDL